MKMHEHAKKAQRLVFVAGPFRGMSAWDISENMHRASVVALDLWRMGMAVICPHLNCGPFQGAVPDGVWIRGDLTMLERCDAIILIPRWQESEGARNERAFAYSRKIPVFLWPDQREQIVAWVTSSRTR